MVNGSTKSLPYCVLAIVIFAWVGDFYSKMRQGALARRAAAGGPTDFEVIQYLRQKVRLRAPSLLDGVVIFPARCSYCENRMRIFLKMRRVDGSLYPMHELLYVLLHELAHVVCKSEPDYHGPKFVDAFGEIMANFPEVKIMSSQFRLEDYTLGCNF